MLLRELFRLAWPVLVAQLAVMANGVADTVMAGRLSAVDLAAVGIGASVYITVFVTAMGVLLALSPMVAHHYGAGRAVAVGQEVRQAAWLALLLAAVVVILLRNPEPFLALSRLRPEVEDKVREYLDAVSWSAPPTLMFRVFYGFSSGIGQPRPVMVLNLLGLLLKLPLNAIFMFGLLGAPAMGGPGCAVASALAGWLVFLAMLGWCRRNREYAPYGLFAEIGFWKKPATRRATWTHRRPSTGKFPRTLPSWPHSCLKSPSMSLNFPASKSGGNAPALPVFRSVSHTDRRRPARLRRS